MTSREKKFTCIGLAVGLVLAAVVYFATASFQHGHAEQQATRGERKVLYWYDAMDAQHHYEKPGKAPDGMDLVPMYADQVTPTAPGTRASTATKGERKILYWYDPMHPQYKADKPGTAPDCGMDLVPKYADEQPMTMAPGLGDDRG